MPTDPARNSFRIALPQRLWWILATHAVLLFAIWSFQGILLDKEALKYMGCAHDVLAGDFGDLLHRYRLYASYVLFLVPFTAMGMAELAVAAQIALGLGAAFSMRRMVLRLGGSVVRADLAFAALLLAFPIQTWTLALYSESFFVSLSVIFFAEALRSEGIGYRFIALAVLLVFARPVGILFVVPVLAWRLSNGCGRARLPAVWAASGAVLAAVLVLPVIGAEQLRVVVEGHVIGGFPQWPGTGTAFHGNSLAGAQLEVLRQEGPAAWAWTLLRRIGWLFAPWRPWFSAFHIALTAPLVLFYPLAALTVLRRWHLPFVQVGVVVLLLNSLLVGLMFAEWNGRFLVPLLPLVFVLGMIPGRRSVGEPEGTPAHGHPPGQQQ